jgi:urease accessory protein
MDTQDPLELRINERLAETSAPAEVTLTLPFEARQKSRLRTCLDNGADVGLFLPRGTVLRHGDRLRTTNGLLVEVRAAAETVSTARGSDPLLLARAAYHLGNRHVALQIGPGWLRYLHDHVLDDMVRELGLELCCEQAPFEPEAGAYGGAQGAHHDHAH